MNAERLRLEDMEADLWSCIKEPYNWKFQPAYSKTFIIFSQHGETNLKWYTMKLIWTFCNLTNVNKNCIFKSITVHKAALSVQNSKYY